VRYKVVISLKAAVISH